jgi:hypothetical protein
LVDVRQSLWEDWNLCSLIQSNTPRWVYSTNDLCGYQRSAQNSGFDRASIGLVNPPLFGRLSRSNYADPATLERCGGCEKDRCGVEDGGWTLYSVVVNAVVVGWS